MNTLKLTKKDFNRIDSYSLEYVGKTDVSNYDGHIEIEENLGLVRFNGNIKASGHIWAGAGSTSTGTASTRLSATQALSPHCGKTGWERRPF